MRRFVVFADTFNEDIGGVIALHRLVDLINRAGREALLWPMRRPPPGTGSSWALLRYHWRMLRKPYRVGPGFVAPLARPRDLEGAIVVYPEIIDANPLGAHHVVRWLLHRPGHHKEGVRFGPDDRFFFYQHAFNDPVLNPETDNLLKTSWVRDDVYRQTNFGPRHGSAYILRKGTGRPLVHDLRDSVLADGRTHADLGELFNRVQTCISYDPYTMYSHFAALCGCDSVIVPEPGVSKEQWYPDPADRYGLAYGFDDLEEARATRALLLPRLKSQEAAANASVAAFIAKCDRYFPE